MTHIDLARPAGDSADRSDLPAIPEALLSEVLEPYAYKGCRYLVDARTEASADAVVAYGNFSITESAYIRSTGHFNAVELVLCFNQLAYCAFAPAIIDEKIPQLRGWSMADFYKNQLPAMLIKSAKLRFRRLVDARHFSARLVCRDFTIVERTWRYLLIPCSIEFWDDHGGSAHGEFELAALNIP